MRTYRGRRDGTQMASLSLYLPAEVAEEILSEAKRRGRTPGWLVARVWKTEAVKKMLVPRAKGVTYETK